MGAHRAIRILSREESGRSNDFAERTPAERIGAMWRLAVDAWTMKGEAERAESRLPRHNKRAVGRLRDRAALEALKREAPEE